jgi:integrase
MVAGRLADMASLEQRGNHFRIIFRLGRQKLHATVKATDRKEAESAMNRLEENLRLVERGRLTVPDGADVGLFLLTDGKLEKKIEYVKPTRLSELISTYRTEFTAGAKEKITRRMEDIHLNHLLRIIGDVPVAEITAASVQRFVDSRSRESHNGQVVKTTTVRKAVATLRFVMNWGARRSFTANKYPEVELFFPKERQAEPFRTFDQIAVIIARGGLNKQRIEELWNGLFMRPEEVAEVLEIVRKKTGATWLYPFLVTAAHTGARRAELFRSRVEDFDFGNKLILIRELKRSKAKETFRTVDMTPMIEKFMKEYFEQIHPGGLYSFCSEANKELTDGQAWKAFRTAVKGSKWEVLRGYHSFRHSFASNLAAAGIDARVISELMGHQTADMEKRYRHLFPEQRRAAVVSVYGQAS